MILDELIALLGFKIDGEEDYKKFTKQLDQLEKKAENVGKAIGRMAVVAAAATTAAFGFLGKSVIETSAQFESFEATLTTIEGSSEKAKQSLSWISDFAKKTPYDVAGVTEAFVKLRAYGLDPTNGMLVALGDASSAMGKPLMQSVEAIADAVTGENERLKEFGITTKVAGDNITYTWRENGKELTKTLKKNGVEIAKFLTENFEGRFAGAMERQSKTWNGMMSNLGDTWVAFQRMIGDAGFFEAMSDQLRGLLDWLQLMQDNGSMQKWAQRLSDVLTTLANTAGAIVSQILGHFMAISNWIDNNPDLFDKLKYAILALGAIKFPRTFALLVLDDILSTLEGKDSVISRIAQAIADFTGLDADTLKKVISAIAGMAVFATIAGGVGSLAGALRLLAGAISLIGGSAVAAGIANLKKIKDIGSVGGAGASAAAAGGGIMSKLGGLLRAGGLGFIAATTLGGNGELGSLSSDKVLQMMADQKAARTGGASESVPMTAAQAISNAMANSNKMAGDRNGGAVTATDNSNRSVTNNITTRIQQNVTQATDAPGAAASATADAVNKAAQPARMQGNAAGSGAF